MFWMPPSIHLWGVCALFDLQNKVQIIASASSEQVARLDESEFKRAIELDRVCCAFRVECVSISANNKN